MALAENIVSYDEALASFEGKTRHLLLGNGFSIACDQVFRYDSLYSAAVAAGLSERAQLVFERLGTNNFEGVMRLLDDSHWVAQTYGLISAEDNLILNDVEVVKRTLVDAVATSHLAHTGLVSDQKKTSALRFFSPYTNIFTTNYDLLAYWVNLAAKGGPLWQDGFRSSDEEAPYVVFTQSLGNKRGLFHIHGALHLFVVQGELRKHCWSRTGRPLTELVKEGLAQNNYPLFVAEGTADQKLEQIQRSGYLWYCLSKLAKIESPLTIFGHALGPSDSHILDVIIHSKCPHIAIGLFGHPAEADNQNIYHAALQMQAKRLEIIANDKYTLPLRLTFFESGSANIWG
jgi:hypothetical protein